jgi:hypothetical protein
MKSVMSHTFSQVPSAEIQRSKFDRSHGVKTAFDSGKLIPVYVDEALPGDTFNCRLTAITRMATPIYPIMDNIFMDTHFFAVPVRLIWDNWQKFMGEQTNPGDSTDYLVPEITSPSGGWTQESLPDYMGIPTKVDLTHSALWTRAYNLIWNEWFRDENLQNSITVDTDDGPDSFADYLSLQRRGKRHDYFTSCLPWPQKGDAVSLPLGDTAAVHGIALDSNTYFSDNYYDNLYETGGNTTSGRGCGTGGVGTTTRIKEDPNNTGYPGIYADLSTATASTINQLRQAFQIQKLLERDARGGTRYIEIIRSHFGVVSPDARVQRPEYLGGGSSPIQVTPVPQTSSTDVTSPQGNLSAYASAVLNNHGFTKSFTEHCVIIGLVSTRADLTYQQGLNRMFSRSTRYDYFWPALSHIGEQAVLNKEIYAQGTTADDDVFGYQERYAEYRYKPSTVTGAFRSNHSTSLDAWHLCQDFSSLPALNSSFIQEQPPISRVVAVTTEPEFIFDGYIKLITARPMPLYSQPGLIDHF